MTLRQRVTFRLVRALHYYGVLKHPYGRDYARQRYTPFGGESR